MPVELNGVVLQGSTLLGAGTRLTQIPVDREGVVLRFGAPSATLIGGGANDQLYAVATRSTGALAAGLARSFRGPLRNADPAFLVTLPLSGVPTAVVHENLADVGLQPRAIDVTSTGYLLAGQYDDGAECYLGLVNQSAQPGATVRFSLAGATAHRVRQVRVVGTTAVVVGDATVNGVASGFFAGFQVSTLAALYGFRVVDPTFGLSLADVAASGTTMTAVGPANLDSVVVTFDAQTGRQASVSRVLGVRLQSIAGPAPFLVSGLRGGGLVAARVAGNSLEGTLFSNLTNPSNISPLPMVRVDGGAIVFGRSDDAGLVELELNDDLRAGCNGAVSGQPVRYLLDGDAGVSLLAAPPAVASITVRVTPVVPSQTAFSLAPSAACWP